MRTLKHYQGDRQSLQSLRLGKITFRWKKRQMKAS
jgi:hypothetical protein